MKVLVGAFNQEKALVGAVIVKIDGALHSTTIFTAFGTPSRGGAQFEATSRASRGTWRSGECENQF